LQVPELLLAPQRLLVPEQPQVPGRQPVQEQLLVPEQPKVPQGPQGLQQAQMSWQPSIPSQQPVSPVCSELAVPKEPLAPQLAPVPEPRRVSTTRVPCPLTAPDPQPKSPKRQRILPARADGQCLARAIRASVNSQRVAMAAASGGGKTDESWAAGSGLSTVPPSNGVSLTEDVAHYDPEFHGPDPFAPRVSLMGKDPFAPPPCDSLLSLLDARGLEVESTALRSAAEDDRGRRGVVVSDSAVAKTQRDAVRTSQTNSACLQELGQGTNMTCGGRSPGSQQTASIRLMRRLRVHQTVEEPAAIDVDSGSESDTAIVLDSSSEGQGAEPPEPLWYFTDGVGNEGIGFSAYDSEPAFRSNRPDRAFRPSWKRTSPARPWPPESPRVLPETLGSGCHSARLPPAHAGWTQASTAAANSGPVTPGSDEWWLAQASRF